MGKYSCRDILERVDVGWEVGLLKGEGEEEEEEEVDGDDDDDDDKRGVEVEGLKRQQKQKQQEKQKHGYTDPFALTQADSISIHPSSSHANRISSSNGLTLNSI